MRWRRGPRGEAPARTATTDLPPIDLPPRADRGALVVVLAPTRARAAEALDGTAWATAGRRVLTARGLDRLHARISRLPRVDLVLDLRSSWGPGQLARWRRLFGHVGPGGSWVAVRTAAVAGRRERLAERHGVAAGPVRLVQRHQRLLKIRDAEAVELLGTREPALSVTVLGRLPGGVLDRRGAGVHHHGGPVAPLADDLPYPPAQIRHYRGPVHVAAGRAYVVHGRSLLPESFRWHLSDHPVNRSLVDVDSWFASQRRSADPHPPTLPGRYFHLDYTNPGHYGHLMTEGFSRLWGWPVAKAADPSLKLLLALHRRRDVPASRRPESVLLPALGIGPDDVVWLRGPVTVTSLVGTTPLWHNAAPFHAHPAVRETWERLRDGLLALPDAAPLGSTHLFVTRRAGNRPVRNLAEVEELAARAGYTVVDPGVMSIPEQAATFAAARVVAGFGGTGMFNLVFARHLEAIVVLSHSSYAAARNEELLAAVHGAEAHFFWSPPDLAEGVDPTSYQAFQAPWRFDTERHGEALRRVLRDLVH
ncbi:glycosyltransferase family 61 protein [Nocardioides marmotae]|uniref:glycosyltransferase family 61 protein n=1 Tax=Nocardioides marmotae TaxID=2663857 RepID=UPI0012B60D33|nr:glycosyltransferase family 61 protein [Nocardioides marmotae]MBC9732119.1 glycosyltransferase family 61 protein [Nocardioides marmotae]MTB83240.1 DUF563 domain-containing protein [Nocardioides marmotae]